MGITGLLPLLKGVGRPVNLQEFSGKKVAVDAYCWLHRGCCSCAVELCQNQPTAKYNLCSNLTLVMFHACRYIVYCLNQVRMLLHFGIKPILVFDGAPLPAKKSQEILRLEYVVG